MNQMQERLSHERVAEIRREAESAAGQVLDAFWDPDKYPVDPVAIARAYGAEVHFADLPEDYEGLFRPAAMAGEHLPQIWVDTDTGPQRRRFSVAHELGHLVEDGEKAQIDRRRSKVTSLGSDPHEVYANAFAAELLMPEFAVKQLFKLGASLSGMASFFGVSAIAMENRVRNLGLQ